MAGSVNKCLIIGNVGKDPDIRTTDGGKIANFSIATSETWKDKATGERAERTDWHRVVVFNDRIADVVEKYVRKGHKVYVEGSLQTRKYMDKDGNEKYTTEVVIGKFRGELTMLGGKDDGGDAHEPAERRPAITPARGRVAPVESDEIPF